MPFTQNYLQARLLIIFLTLFVTFPYFITYTLNYYMHSKLLIFFAAILLLAASNHSTSKDRVRTVYHINMFNDDGQMEVNPATTDTFYYTSDGKRDYGLNDNNPKEERTGNMIECTTIDKSGTITLLVKFLNDRGQVDSMVNRYETVTNYATNPVPYAHKYIYDANGYMVEDRQYSNKLRLVAICKYKVVDGNTVEERNITIPSMDTSTRVNPETLKMDTVVTKYCDIITNTEFYTDKQYMPRNENFGSSAPDMLSKNLEKKRVQYTDMGDTIDVTFFHYTFDDKERVTSVKRLSHDNQEFDSTAYTYY